MAEMAAEQHEPQEKQEAPPARRNEAGVGALLKASRLRVGEDLRDIADILRIRYVYMEAIEDGRYDALPGPTYAAGFIRAYAEHLGLDSEEVVRRFKSEGVASREAADLVFPEPIPEPGIPGGAVILVGIVVAVVAYGAWYVNTSKEGFLVELVSPLPDRLANLVDGDGKPAATPAPAATDAAATPQTQPQTQTPAAEPEAKPEIVATTPEAKPEVATTTPEAKPEAKPEVAATTPEAKPEAKPEVAATTPAAKPEAKPEAAATTPQPEAKPEPAPVAAAPTPAEPTRAAPAQAAAETAAPATVPESRETPVVTARPPEPAAPIEPVIAPANVPVDMIPPSRPATTAAPTPEPAAPTTTTAAATPAETMPAAAPAPAAEATPPAAATTIGEAGTRILVRAKTNSWIQVRDDNANELLVTRLLRSGDSYAVPNRAGLRLSTGNAGALEILVDGEAVPAIGDDGSVRRNVLLDAEKLKAGQAVTE